MDLDQYLEKMITNTIVIWILFTYKYTAHIVRSTASNLAHIVRSILNKC